jgi:hypothetical protein
MHIFNTSLRMILSQSADAHRLLAYFVRQRGWYKDAASYVARAQKAEDFLSEHENNQIKIRA